jgi:DNA replication ATP-dependent helicase Dna2
VTEFALEASGVVDGLRQFVRDEFACQRQVFARQMAEPREHRVRRGTCLDGLIFCGMENGRAMFRHGGNDSRLRESDLVLLRTQDGVEEGGLMSIYREESDTLWLVGEGGFRPDRGGAGPWMIDEAFLDLERQYLEALERLPGTAVGRERILPLLMGKAEPRLDEGDYGRVHAELETSETAWEEMQREAIAGCVAADHCYLVQGPPGTGKTRVLAQVVKALVEEGRRVLVTSFTHRAIDHALGAVAREVADREAVARFGAMVHGRDEPFDRFEFFSESGLGKRPGRLGWVAGATPFALRRRLSGVQFDVIVFDEAGQITAPLAILAMLTGQIYLFFGDQKQLGPVVVSRSRREVGEVGIFQTLRSKEIPGTLLNVTYRMNEELVKWPSESFYQGELCSAPSVAGSRLRCAPEAGVPGWQREALDPANPLIWLRFAGREGRTENEEESAAAAELIVRLVRLGVGPEEIAVVTPYRRQARKVRRRLETLDPGRSWSGCVIDTVERMQGQEREVVLVTFSAAHPGFLLDQAEFLFDPRRINVSATRARTKLILLASDSLLEVDPCDTDLGEEVALLRSLLVGAVEVAHSSCPSD